MQAFLQEYSQNYLLFVYGVDGQIWGQWDTPTDFLPRYKTTIDRRSPIPPELDFSEWRKRYRNEIKSLPKCFMNVPESFLRGKGLVGHGVGKEVVKEGNNKCASPDGHTRLNGAVLPSLYEPQLETRPETLFPVETKMPTRPASGMTPQQENWFSEWWSAYWLHKAKKAARLVFERQVRNAETFERVMTASRSQSPEMLCREPQHRPHGATWLNGERWADEITSSRSTHCGGGMGNAIDQAMQILSSQEKG